MAKRGGRGIANSKKMVMKIKLVMVMIMMMMMTMMMMMLLMIMMMNLQGSMAKRGWRGIANSKDKRNTSQAEGADRVGRVHRSPVQSTAFVSVPQKRISAPFASSLFAELTQRRFPFVYFGSETRFPEPTYIYHGFLASWCVFRCRIFRCTLICVLCLAALPA